MDSLLPVFSNKHLEEQSQPAPGLRLAAQFFSIIFHPLLISAYTIAFLIFLHPAAFVGVDEHIKVLRMLSTLLFTVIYPGITILIAWRLKLVRSLALHNMQDRIVGFLITMFFYWWTWNVFRNLPDVPPVAVHFALGSFLAICGGWMCNIFFKISMHALAVGGLCCFFIIFGMHDPFATGMYISVSILIAGIVCSSRLLLNAHSSFEIVTGLIVGVLGQMAGWFF